MRPDDTSRSRASYSREQEDFDYIRLNVPCQEACPADTNIPAYIRALYEERYGHSYEINRTANVLPGVLGRICSRPCEDRCRHGEPELGRPVNICHIKRAASDLKKDYQGPDLRRPAISGKKVAIVGAGPAGLAAAQDLATTGVAVTLYEAFEKAGGMLRYGIPEFRLPRGVIDEEVDYIVGLGVRLRTGIRVGTDISLEELVEDHDAVLMAAGCYQSNRLGIPGEETPGVYPGLEFMIDLAEGRPPALGRRVLVIGDGFTAFDCARSALRLGSRDVRLCSRLTEEDLLVTRDEIMEARLEGVRFEFLVLAAGVTGKKRVEGVEFLRTLPGDAGPDGIRGFSTIEGSGFVLGADSVVVAIGQKPGPLDFAGVRSEPGPLAEDRESYGTSIPGLYLAGDFMTGPSTVIEAVAQGRRAAGKILEDLTGKRFRERVVRMEEADVTDRQRAWDFLPRQEMPTVLPVAERLAAPGLEVEAGYSPERAADESRRCYLCYLHYEIDMRRCIYCRYCIDVAPRDCIKLVREIRTGEHGEIVGLVETRKWSDVNAVVIDNVRCIRCGACLRVCPTECISVTRVERVERFLPEDAGSG